MRTGLGIPGRESGGARPPRTDSSMRGKDPSTMVQIPRVSVVIPVLNEAGCLPRLHQELRSVCDRAGLPVRVRVRR